MNELVKKARVHLGLKVSPQRPRILSEDLETRPNMKLLHSFATLLLAIQPAIATFTFTSPAAGSALNLSAPSINIQWDGSTSQYPLVDLVFSGNAGAFSYTLVSNISVTTGSYQWNPANKTAALQSGRTTLSSGKDFQFQAMTHENNSRAGAIISSASYSVIGYPYIGAGTSLRPHVGAILLMILISVAVLG